MDRLRKAVFLDRDGVINKERKDYVKKVSELEILSHVSSAIKKLKEYGYLVVVITNQSAVNRGLTSHEDINEIHLHIQEHLKKEDTFIDAFYYCPHTPDENCECRKPKPGMLLKAEKELRIDLRSSWMIGDNKTDLEAAELVGCKSILVTQETNLNMTIQDIILAEQRGIIN